MGSPDRAVLVALLRSVADRVEDSDVPELLRRISNEGVAGGLREAAGRLERAEVTGDG
jgi:hypothetical protein